MSDSTLHRRLGYWAFGLLLPALALVALALFARTETALRWAASQAAAWSDGRVLLEDVSGSILGPLRAGRVIYRDETTEVTVDALELNWNPLGLLAGHARITRLTAASATVINQPSSEPTRLPDHIGLPYPVSVVRVELARLVFRGEDYETVLEQIAGRIDALPGQYRFRLDSLRYQDHALSGDATLGSRNPFPASGTLALTAAVRQRKLALPLGLSGALENLRIDAALEDDWGKGTGFVLLAPFAEDVVRELRADLRDINPARIQRGFPEADLAFGLTARQAGSGLGGTVHAENRRPGTVDLDLLPIETVDSTFELTDAEIRLEDLRIGLGKGGGFAGRGLLHAGGVRFSLKTEGINLNALHRSLKPLRPSGTVELTATGDQQDIVARLQSGIYRLALDAFLAEQRLTIRDASLRAKGSELGFQGQVSLDGARPFSVSGVLRDFDPSQWGEFPPARLNARLGAEGQMSPAIQLVLNYQLGRSRFRNEPVEGEGKIEYGPGEAVGGEGYVALGGNRVAFRGRLGGDGQRLDWTLEAPRLAALGTEFTGSLAGGGWIAGGLKNPSFTFDLKGADITSVDMAVKALEGHGSLGTGPAGELRLDLVARGLKAGQVALDTVSTNVAGARNRHSVTLAASGPGAGVNLTAEGGFDDALLWSGTLLTLESAKPQPLKLVAPVRITLATDQIQAGSADIAWGGGRLSLEYLSWRPGALGTRGRAASVPLTLLIPRPDNANWQSSLVLGGEWDLDFRNQLDGRIRLWRERGDIALGSPKPVSLGLTELTAEFDARGSAVEARAAARGTGLGAMTGRFETRLERGDGRWRLARTAPLSGELQATMPSIAWLGPLVDPTLALSGTLEMKAAASGTVSNPRLQGSVSGSRLEAHVDAAGFHLAEGTLEADFTDDRLLLRQLTLRGGEGTVKASGFMSFAEGDRRGELDYKLERLALVKMPAQLLEVSGDGTMRLEGQIATLSGSIRADRGLIEVREWDRPRLSDDVVIVGREVAAPAAGPSRLRLALDLDLGDDFRVKGAGLDARLQGTIQVRTDEGVMKAKGVVRVAEGYYKTYGTQLQIERGALLFDGPLSNPVLDILAMRKNQAVEAGVAITGTALSPRTKLVSNPTVPDQEKLSWLVLGQGTGARDDSVFSLPGSKVPQDDVVSVGTQLTSSLYVGVGRSLAGTATVLKLTYVLSDRWSVQTRSGDATGLTLIYTISFD